MVSHVLPADTVTSGYTKNVILDKGIEDGEFDFIAKPFSLGEFLKKIRHALDR